MHERVYFEIQMHTCTFDIDLNFLILRASTMVVQHD